MPSTREYLDFVLEQLSDLDGIAYRKMMGEYILYYRGRIVGGIYDNRLLVKPVAPALALMPEAPYAVPYRGAKAMLLVQEIDEPDFLSRLFMAMYAALPAPKQKKSRL
ncbi:TfoX/Sxy family protein [Desulfobulbus oralis]|uniref:Competence protein TfoX n=1 Tax=Desulfobulbus oralis TaxID=1986146 RepID=A0A2L1GPI2_9BACT|nr:TfoX/Sxy family protein [Desulfobulbus oralis]AVD71579.1 competence protein TfoX [Desulfobulbus oralis]